MELNKKTKFEDIKEDKMIESNKTNEYIKRHLKEAKEIISNERIGYSHDEMMSMLKQVGL